MLKMTNLSGASEAPAISGNATPESVDVAIIGGGLGGLALAAGLRRRGIDAHVFEAAPRLRNETSTMISLGPNAWVALQELHPDLPADLRWRGVEDCQVITRLRPPPGCGLEPTTIDRPGAATRLTTIRWAETQDALALLVPDEVVHCDHAAAGYTEEWGPAAEVGAEAAAGSGSGCGGAEEGAASVEAAAAAGRGPARSVLVHFRGGQPSVRAKLAVGADGIFSAIRAAMHPHEPPPRYLGHMNWNCLLHNPGGNTVVDAHKPGQVIFTSDGAVSASERREPSLMSYVCDAGGGYTFWQVRMQYEQPSFTVDLLRRQQREQEGRPQQQEEAEQEEQDNGGADEGSANVIIGGGGAGRRGRGGMGVPGSKARCLERLKAAGWDPMVPLVAATPEAAVFERALYDRLPLAEGQWAAPGRRVVLLGDSAHGMHPGPGQGARSAFEDAHQLALALEALWPDVPAAVERYLRARVTRANRVQRFASESCGLAAVRQAAAPPGLSPAQLWDRSFEFRAWFDQYPANMHGDPASTYWKPPPPSLSSEAAAAEAEAAAEGAAGGEGEAVEKEGEVPALAARKEEAAAAAAGTDGADLVSGGDGIGTTDVKADGAVVQVRVVAHDGGCNGRAAGAADGEGEDATGGGGGGAKVAAKGQGPAAGGGGGGGVQVTLAVVQAV